MGWIDSTIGWLAKDGNGVKLALGGAAAYGLYSASQGSNTPNVTTQTTIPSQQQQVQNAYLYKQMEEQASRDRYMFNLYKDLDADTVAAYRTLIDPTTNLTMAQIQSQQAILPYQEAASIAGFKEFMDDLEANKPIKDAFRNYQLNTFENIEPLAKEYYAQLLEKPSEEEYRAEAAADVTGSFEKARGTLERRAQSLGLGQEKVLGELSDLGAEEALQSATAKTRATRFARDEYKSNLERGLLTASSALSGQAPSTQLPSISNQSFSLPNPNSTSQGLYGQSGGLVSGLTDTSTKVTSTPTDNVGLGGFLGNLTAELGSRYLAKKL